MKILRFIQFPELRTLAMVAFVNPFPSPSSIQIQTPNISLRGIIATPVKAESIVVFAHGPDSSNLSPRNRLVARSLLQRGIAVLLPDLVGTSYEELEDENVWEPEPTDEKDEIAMIASRLTAIIDWLGENPSTRKLRIGLFGGRTGAAAAMMAAALRPKQVHAVVSRGGRPDLAEELLEKVMAPTLMIVGGNDHAHIRHNQKAGMRMHGKPMLELIHGANHLFGEPGKLEEVASISYHWFHKNLALCG